MESLDALLAAVRAASSSLPPIDAAWPVVLALAAIPILHVVWALLGALHFLLRPATNVRKYGQWAVVTGGTDGIGLGFVQELARRGMSVVVIGRNAEKLTATEAAVKAKSPKVQVKTISLDFSTADDAAYEKVSAQLKDLTIGVLINNVGVSYEHAAYLTEIDDALIERLINVNVRALTKMTRMVLPGMVTRGRGAIVNVGSAAGLIPTGDPLYAVYSGTKAYVDFFSRSLNLELKSKRVHVECSVPYFVVSNMSRIRKPSLMIPKPETYARAALNKIGYAPTVVPYWPHALQHFVITHVPTFVAAWFVLSHHADVRKRALRKKAEKAQ